MDESKEALCGTCYVPLKPVTNANPENRFACPSCGNSDTRENVLRAVGEYAQEMAAQHLQKTMAGIAKGSKFIKYTPALRPKRVHRFVVDLDIHPITVQQVVKGSSDVMKLD